MRIEQSLTVQAPAERVWAFLTDIPAMSECIPGVEKVEQVDDQNVKARIKTRVGPISVTFDCHVSILSLDEETYTGSAEVVGRDTRLGAGVRAVLEMSLVQDGENTTLNFVTETDLSGKIAQYGHGIIKQRANAMAKSFGQCVQKQLA